MENTPLLKKIIIPSSYRREVDDSDEDEEVNPFISMKSALGNDDSAKFMVSGKLVSRRNSKLSKIVLKSLI